MTLLDDARYGLRLLWKAPGFTAIAAGTLALAIAANTAIFSVVYATLLAPMAYPDPDQLVMVWSSVDGDDRRSRPPTSGTGAPRATRSRHWARGPAAA